MTAVLEGVRILEVAEHTFVPAASALLSDWGAEVIKIEHPERGDGMRGLAATGMALVAGDVHPLLEHSNRGKKSLGLDLKSPEGLEVLHRLIATSDVFLTNKVPQVREDLGIGLDAVRAHNDKIIYVAGTGQGERGPDANNGSYDALAFWARAGVALGAKRPEYDLIPVPPAPGFGDSIGGMTIAGGIMGALYHREKTGEATTVDVSLMGVGMWAMGQAIALSLVLDMPWAPPPDELVTFNPMSRNYKTSDDRTIAMTCLTPGKYWAEFCGIVGKPELATDERFADVPSLLANTKEAIPILDEVFASATLAEWRERLGPFTGQWAVVQDTLEAVADPQSEANGYVQDCETAAGTPFRLVAGPVQFGGEPAQPHRAPELNEHGDEILESLGYDMEAVLDLKVKGVVT